METVWRDLRHGARLLLRTPTVTLVAIFSLALGIGANTAMFSWLNGLVLNPLQVAEPEELVHVYSTNPSGFLGSHSYLNFRDERERNEVFRGYVATRTAPVSFEHGTSSERLFARLVSSDFWDVIGAEAARGRTFGAEEDDVPGRDAVVVLSHALWQRRLGGDPAAVGRSVQINGHPFTVIGVLPEGFRYATLSVETDLYAPLAMTGVLMPGPDRLASRGWGFLSVFARLEPGVEIESAQAHMDVVAAELAREHPDANENRQVRLVPETEALLPQPARRGMVSLIGVLMGVVGFVLLIACANVANLQMARGTARRTEIVVRRALGADKTRIVRQLLTESLLLSALAAAVGVGLASLLNRLLVAIPLPVGVPLSLDVSLDLRVLAFTVGVTVIAGILFGLAPALTASRPQSGAALPAGATARVVGTSRLRHLLVALQVGLSLVLLVGAALFLESFRQARSIDPGFDPDGLLLASVDPNLQGYGEEAARRFYRELAESVGAVPGVRSVALAESPPLQLAGGNQWGVEIDGYVPAPDERMNIDYNTVTPGYFATLGIPVLAGRAFGPEDRADGEGALIVNAAMAERFWAGADPLGRPVRTGGRDRRVVGVVGDTKIFSLGETRLPAMYFPYEQAPQGAALTLHVRAEGDPLELVDAVRSRVRSLDPSLPIYDVQTLNERIALALLPSRLSVSVLGAFGVTALLMAAVGIYGVLAFTVSQRTREIGLRMALGARAADIRKLILGGAMRVISSGVLAGLVGGFALSRILRSFLYGPGELAWTSVATATVGIVSVALLASYLPARRASRIDPMSALRQE